MTKYWIPNQGAATSPPPPVHKCRVCGGKGYTFFEAGPGVPTQQRTCDYCKGSGTDAWVHENHAKDERRHNRRTMAWRIGGITFVFGMVATESASFWALNDWNDSGWIVLHYLLWLVAIFVVCRLVVTTPAWKAWKARRAGQAGDGFTSTEERVLGTAFLAGSALKFQHDERLRREQETQQQISDWMKRHP